jgi:hyperosmotically inducible protein
MKQMKHWWVRATSCAGVGAVLLFGSVALAAVPDAWITTKAKLALLTTSDVSSNDVNVDTIGGHVTLHGTVSSEQEKMRAEQAVRGIDGVKDVRNMLAVVKPSKQDAVATADDKIKSEVEQRLAQDKSLADSSIKVSSVNAGNVVLTGSAASLSDHLKAVEDARRVPGVRQVASEVKSPDTLSDNEIWRETGKPVAGDAPSSASDTMSDMWITSAAKVHLIADDQTPATEINIDTRNGVVTMFGIVPSEAAKRAAEGDVKKVSGVKSVRNELQVVPTSAKEAVKEKDEEVKDRVAKRVDETVSEGSNVDVEVKNGVVRLTGKVKGQTDRLSALTTARSTPGVRSVVDDLQVAVQ